MPLPAISQAVNMLRRGRTCATDSARHPGGSSCWPGCSTLRLLKAAGCLRVYVDGSFVTSKEEPGDFDACWDTEGVDFDLADERLLTFDRGRATQKAAFLGELFIADARADPQGTLFREFFQTDREGRRKGIVLVELKDLP
jgi:hypothetical protein